jgi:hypothetical protein
VSQLGERLWEDYQAFAQRDLGEYEIIYLFVDGFCLRASCSACTANGKSVAATSNAESAA